MPALKDMRESARQARVYYAMMAGKREKIRNARAQRGVRLRLITLPLCVYGQLSQATRSSVVGRRARAQQRYYGAA